MHHLIILLSSMEQLSYSPFETAEQPLASKWARFWNFSIDSLFFLIFYFAMVVIISIVLSFTDEQAANSFANSFEGKHEFLQRLISTLVYALFMTFQETLTKGRSLGKWITKTKVLTEDGETPSTLSFLKRNFSRCVPFELFSALFDLIPWHDQWSDTRVVKL